MRKGFSSVENGSAVFELESSLDEIHVTFPTYAFSCWPVSWRS